MLCDEIQTLRDNTKGIVAEVTNLKQRELMVEAELHQSS